MLRSAIVSGLITLAGCGQSQPVAPPPTAQPVAQQVIIPPATREVQRSLEGQLFLTSMLIDLDSFRGSEEFRIKGFAQSSKHKRWLDQMQAVKQSPDFAKFTQAERIAVGDLESLGMQYMQNRNQEEDYTRFARAEINRVIGQ